jgi:hypothetical protein
MIARSTTLLLAALGLLNLVTVESHVALWSDAMFGFCDGGNGISTECENTSKPCVYVGLSSQADRRPLGFWAACID